MKRVLLLLDSDPVPNVYDVIVGYDGGADHIARTRRLQLREPVLSIDLHRTEDVAIEPGGAVDVPHRQRNMRQPVGLDHPLYMTRQILPFVSSVM